MTLFNPNQSKQSNRPTWFLSFCLVVLVITGSLLVHPKVQAFNTTYYVSTSGNDSNNGTSASTPFKTIAKVNSLNLGPGDKVLFKCGDVWQGESLEIKYSGANGNPLVFGSYPTDNCADKPVISGSLPITGWTVHSGNIYVADLNAGANAGRFPNGINQLFKNNNRLQFARWPNLNAGNSGYSIIDGQPAGNQIVDNQLPAGNWTKAIAHIRSMTWYISNREVTGRNGNTLTLNAPVNCYSGASSGQHCAANGGWGFWLDNALAAIDQDGEWFWDRDTNKVYLQSNSGLPTGIEGSKVMSTSPDAYGGISLGARSFPETHLNYVTVQNFEVRNWFMNGISTHERQRFCENSNLILDNNTIKNVVGDGIRLMAYVYDGTNTGAGGCGSNGWRGGSNLTVSNNLIDGANQHGIQTVSSNSTYSGNIIRNTGLYANLNWQGLGGSITDGEGQYSEKGAAINLRRLDTGNAFNNTFTLNTLQNNGYTGFYIFGNNNNLNKNFIKDLGLTKAEAVAIRLYGSSGQGNNNTVTNNIIDNVTGNVDGTNGDWAYTIPRGGWGWGIHADKGSTGNTITNNTIANVSAMGINVTDYPSGFSNATGNTVFNAKRAGVAVSEAGKLSFNNNIVVQNGPSSIGYYIYELNDSQNINSNFNPVNNNYLFNPYFTTAFKTNLGNRTFAQWKTDTGKDGSSIASWYTQPNGETPKAELFYNSTNTTTTINLNGTYVDLNQSAVSSPLSLPAFSSRVLVKTGATPNQNPTVSLTSPTNNQTFTAPANINLAANASDPDGTITKVEFYNGNTLLNTDTSAPYSFSWTNVPAGNYSITAKAYDNNGGVTTSSAITIRVKLGKLHNMVRTGGDKIFINSLAEADAGWSNWVELGGTTPDQPTIAYGVGKLWQIVRGSTDNKIYTRFSTDSGLTWSPWSPDNVSVVYSGVSMVEFNGKVYMVARGTNDNIFIKSSTDGLTWSNWSYANGQTRDYPTIFKGLGKLWIVVRGTDGKIYTSQSSDGVNFSPWVKDEVSVTFSGVSVTEHNGKLYMVARGTNNKIFLKTSTDGNSWSAWQFMNGQTVDLPTIISAFGRIYIEVRGQDNRIYESISTDGTSFSPFQAVPNTFVLSGISLAVTP